jgi:hypothetical protein
MVVSDNNSFDALREWWASCREDDRAGFFGPFDSRADAIAEIDDGIIGRVGYTGPLPWAVLPDGTPKLIDAREVLERLAERVCAELEDEHPEHDDWLEDGFTKAREEELSLALNHAMKAWMDKHGFALPRVIVGIERIDKKEASRG